MFVVELYRTSVILLEKFYILKPFNESIVISPISVNLILFPGNLGARFRVVLPTSFLIYAK